MIGNQNYHAWFTMPISRRHLAAKIYRSNSANCLMLPINRFLVALPLLLVSGLASAGPTIEALPKDLVQKGCTCNFHFVSKNGKIGDTFLQWAEGEDALMWIDGKLVTLKVNPVGVRRKVKGEISRGDREYYSMHNGSLRVRLKCTVTQACDPKDVECESAGYKARVELVAPQGRTTLDATGACGC